MSLRLQKLVLAVLLAAALLSASLAMSQFLTRSHHFSAVTISTQSHSGSYLARAKKAGMAD